MKTKIPFPGMEIQKFFQENKINRLALFGSVLGEDFSPSSFVGILVEFHRHVRIGAMGFNRFGLPTRNGQKE